MKDKLLKIIDRFDQQAIRIRLLLTLVLMAVFAMLVDFLWLADNFKQAESLRAEIVQTDKIIDELIISQTQLNENVVNAKNHPLLKDIEETNQQIEHFKALLEQKTINLIKPEIMSTVLNEILQHSKKLKLLSLTKQAPIELFSQKDLAPEDNTKQLQIYRHLVHITFEGQYDDTESFIRLLEDMPQKVNFESLTYEVDEYPLARIILVVSTLSFDEEWIGG